MTKLKQSSPIIFHFLLALSILTVWSVICHRNQSHDHFSHWESGDAQTLMALEHWRHEGFWKTKFLWIPQGYSIVSRLFDDLPVNHHAHGSKANPDRMGFPGIGVTKKISRAYTHYPSWYAVPYGVLAKFGVTERLSFQMVALSISLFAVVFFYLFLTLRFGVMVAFFSVLFYLIGHGFWRYGDSLANMPSDDLFRFLFLWVWEKYLMEPSRKKLFYSMLAYFGLCLVSIDSLLFFFVWAFLSSHMKGRSLKVVFFLIMSPVLAIGFEFIQNASYLGVRDAFLDWMNQFAYVRTGQGSLNVWKLIVVRYESVLTLISAAFGFGIQKWIWGPIVFFIARGSEKGDWNKFLITFLHFFIAGSALVCVFGKKTVDNYYNYMQYTPAISLFYGYLVIFILKMMSEFLKGQKLVWLRGVPALMFLAMSFSQVLFNSKTWQKNWSDSTDAEFRIRAIFTDFFLEVKYFIPGDRVYLTTAKYLPRERWETNGCPQVAPTVEYYAGGPILMCNQVKQLANDLNYLWEKKQNLFQPIFLVGRGEYLEISETLKSNGWGLEPPISHLDHLVYAHPIKRTIEKSTQKIG